MPTIAAASKIIFPHKIPQQVIKQAARNFFASKFPMIDRLMDIFDNTDIQSRNFSLPLEYFASLTSFEKRNSEYVSIAVEYSIKAIEECFVKVGIKKEDITDIIYISSTGLATPSIDALIINR